MFGLLSRSIRPLQATQMRSFSFVSMNASIPRITSTKTSSILTSSNLQSMQNVMETKNTQFNASTISSLANFVQRRWASRGGFRGGSRGNTYQPNMLKRKRRLGFLARMRSRTGRRIVKDRKEKGRWFLTY